MNKIIAIAKKELNAYFRSPIAYIFIVLTITVFNVLFFAIVDQNREASLLDVFQVMEFMFVFLMPLLTMKIFSEEKSTGTIEFLMTAPVTNGQIVMGKFFGSLIFFTLIILITSIYYFIIEIFATPDRLAILTGYLGIWLEGSLFISIGMLASSWTKNQIIAAITSYVGIFLIYSSVVFLQYFKGTAADVIKYFSVYSHSENFFVGLISLSSLVYFITGIIVMLVLTKISIEKRMWR